MATVIDTGLLTAGIRNDFLQAMATTKTYRQDFCMVVNSNKDKESYKWLGNVAIPREWVGPRQAKGLRTESYDLVNKKYESTMEVDRDELADDQTNQITFRTREMATRAVQFRDKMAFLTLSAGLTTSGYDGVYFFASSHSSGSSGTHTNTLSCTAAGTTVPTVAEAKLAFSVAVDKMTSFKDDQGELMNIDAENGLLVVANPGDMFTWREAIQASTISGSTNVYQGAAKLLITPRVPQNKWYLLKIDGPVKPILEQDREPLEFVALENPNTSDSVFKTDKYLYGTRQRFNFGFGYWQYAILNKWQ